MKLAVRPLTPDRWADLETIFNAAGCSVARSCWCMFYRQRGAQPEPPPGTTRGAFNKARFKAVVEAGPPPGLIGYGGKGGKTPVGWISLGPREDYAKLARSPVMKPVDDAPVWSIICFVVPSAYRGQGVAQALLDAAVKYAKRQGATLLEAYPVDKPGRSHDEFMWFGAKGMFDKAGFEEVARRKPQRPVVRLKVSRSG